MLQHPWLDLGMRQLLFRLRFQLVRQGLNPVRHTWMKEGRVEVSSIITDRLQTAMRKDVRRRLSAEESARLVVTSSGALAHTPLAVSATMRQTFQLGTIRARFTQP